MLLCGGVRSQQSSKRTSLIHSRLRFQLWQRDPRPLCISIHCNRQNLLCAMRAYISRQPLLLSAAVVKRFNLIGTHSCYAVCMRIEQPCPGTPRAKRAAVGLKKSSTKLTSGLEIPGTPQQILCSISTAHTHVAQHSTTQHSTSQHTQMLHAVQHGTTHTHAV